MPPEDRGEALSSTPRREGLERDGTYETETKGSRGAGRGVQSGGPGAGRHLRRNMRGAFTVAPLHPELEMRLGGERSRTKDL